VGVVRVWLGAELRRRWRLHLALALLIGVVGAVILTVGAGARTTASAYDRFIQRQAIADVEMDSVPDEARAAIAGLPGVKAVSAYSVAFAAPAREGVLPGQDMVAFAGIDAAYGHALDRPIVLSGRLPRVDADDEVAVNESAAATFKLRPGSQTKLKSLAADEAEDMLGGRFDKVTFHGPTPTVHIVGVVRTRLDLGQVSYAKNYFFTTPAFYNAYAGKMFEYPPQLDIRLDNPTTAGRFLAAAHDKVAAVAPDAAGDFNEREVAAGLTSIRDSTRVQALALGLVALGAAFAGILGLAQMIARSVGAMGPDFGPLRAMGLGRAARARLTAALFVPAVVVGIVVALVGAWLASPLFPMDIARRTGPPPGLHFDVTTLLAGALLLVIVLLGGAALSASRWRPVPLEVDGSAYIGPIDRVAATLPPTPRIGVRWAIPRRDAPVGRGRAAIAGAIVSVGALVAALTYWAGLDHLVTTPSAYGRTFDADSGEGNDMNQVQQAGDSLLREPAVADVALARIAGSAAIDSTQGDLYGFKSLRGQIGPKVLSGREPATDGEVMLATKTARKLHKGLGASVTLGQGQLPTPIHARVVGIGVLPTIESDQYAEGGAMTYAALDRALADVPQQGGNGDAVIRLKPGVDRSRVLGEMAQRQIISPVPLPPGDVRNLDLVRAYPLWLAGFLAALGLLAVVHALLVSARRRDHQVGVLRALGMTRSQVVGAVSAQGAAMCLLGVAVGAPLGLALGRWTWSASAHQLAVGEGTVVPTVVLAAALGGGLGLLLAVGASAGWWAGRSTPSRALRVP
jgi:hypothetical protein